MKITDLRIGNWVYDPSFKTATKIGYLGFEGIGVLIHGCERVTRKIFLQDLDIEGIPLTEEWLIKMGLKKEKVSGIGGQDMWAGMGAYSYEGEWLFRGNAKHLHLVGYFNAQFRYVHEIQNIFYLLYGKELEISL